MIKIMWRHIGLAAITEEQGESEKGHEVVIAGVMQGMMRKDY